MPHPARRGVRGGGGQVAARWPQNPSKIENPAAEQDSQPEMCGDVQERMQASAQN